MKEIQLTQGQIALVDDEDFEALNKFKWCALKSWNTFYAVRKIRFNGIQRNISMHWDVMGGKGVDHRDRNGCNNQKLNLRFCTVSENAMNKQKQKNCTSIHKGVSFDKYAGKWKTQIMLNGKKIHIGNFDTEAEAARAYNKKAIELFCEFANLNIIV